MSNPISYFFSLSAYEKSFRHVWLKQAIPYTEYERVWDLHITLLKDLYPAVYAYGPNGQHVMGLITALDHKFSHWRHTENTDALGFVREIDDIFHGKFPMHAQILHQLQQQGRMMEVYLYSPQPTDGATARAMNGLLHATRDLSNHAPLPPDIRISLPQNLESLLSLAAAADLLKNHDHYHDIYPAYLAFLERWELPHARIVTTPPALPQEKLIYIPDY